MLVSVFIVLFHVWNSVFCQNHNPQGEIQYPYPQANPSFNSPYGQKLPEIRISPQNPQRPEQYGPPYNNNGMQVDQRNAFQMQRNDQNYTNTNNYVQNGYNQGIVSSPSNDQVCEIDFQRKIERCGQELVSLGVVRQSSSFFQQLIPIVVRLQSRDQLRSICNAHQHFKDCINDLDENLEDKFCFSHGPISAPFALAHAELNYVCGEGYDMAYMGWECYQSSLSKSEVEACTGSVTQKLQQNGQGQPQDDQICTAVNSYVGCIKGPMLNDCGDRALHSFVRTLERGIQARIPTCVVSAASSSGFSILLSLYIVIKIAHYLFE